MKQMITPQFGKQSDDWEVVDSGLYKGQQFDLTDPGYPVPEGCTAEWIVHLEHNDYGETVWVLSARKTA